MADNNYINYISPDTGILLVSVVPFDMERPNSNILANLRYEFFQNERTIKNKVTESWGGISCKYIYSMSKNGPLKWKKYEKDTLIEYVEVEPDCYYIESINSVDYFVQKRVYFSRHHRWLKSEYMSWNQAAPVKIIKPHKTSINANMLLIENGEDIILYPCLMPANDRELAAASKIMSPPDIRAYTDLGYFYYAPLEEATKWGKTLLAVQEYSRRKQEGTIDENVDLVNGFYVDVDSIANNGQVKINIPQEANEIKYNPDYIYIPDEKPEAITNEELSADESIKEQSIESIIEDTQDFSDILAEINTDDLQQQENTDSIYYDEPVVESDEKLFTKDTDEHVPEFDFEKSRGISESDGVDHSIELLSDIDSVVPKITETNYLYPDVPVVEVPNEIAEQNTLIDKIIKDSVLDTDNHTLNNEESLSEKTEESEHLEVIATDNTDAEMNTTDDTDAETNVTDDTDAQINATDDTDKDDTGAEVIATDDTGTEENVEEDLASKTPAIEKSEINPKPVAIVRPKSMRTVAVKVTSEKVATIKPASDVNEVKNEVSEKPASISNDTSSAELTNDYNVPSTDGSSLPWKADKIIPVSASKTYYYIGELKNGSRHGKGRTAMDTGATAYEGEYKNDKRDGFGVYYYKTGKICHVGNWQENRRKGMGMAFNSSDNSVLVSRWDNNEPVGAGVQMDSDGCITYVGYTENGQKNGAGVSFNKDNGSVIVAAYKDNKCMNAGTIFDADGMLVYNGEIKDGKRCGKGTAFTSGGDVLYIGEFADDLFNGDGVLHDEEFTYEGSFKDGMVSGYATQHAKNGEIVYKGSWQNGKYNGIGTLYFKDGGYCEGEFKDGLSSGSLECHDKNGEITYKGDLVDSIKHGKGIEYENGSVVYEGEFAHNKRNGFGNLYEDGNLIYSGNFVDNIKCGFGTCTVNDDVYVGQWENDKYNGMGVLYINGHAKFAGSFKDGVLFGRVNHIENNHVVSEDIYKDGECIYSRRYNESGDRIVYDGNVRNDIPNGMGCVYSEYGEKVFEGILKHGEQVRSTRIINQKILPLPYCAELDGTDYNTFRNACEYALEIAYKGGIYSGQLKNGVPDGCGNIIYSDHSYTGLFSNGDACGKGSIFCGDGSEIEGIFTASPTADSVEISFDDICYNIISPQKSFQ